MADSRAGQPAQPSDLINVDDVVNAYYELVPDPTNPDQRVSFGTSGHRGSSLDTAFNDRHIAAISQAIAEYRAAQGVTGPLFIGKDTHALSTPAWKTAIEVLHANGVAINGVSENEFTPTPTVSRAIIQYNRTHHEHQADGIVVTPSHNPPRDGGFKYDPPTGGPAPDVATKWIANRANELLGDPVGIKRHDFDTAIAELTIVDYLTNYCTDLADAVDFEAIKESRLTIGADPLGGASLAYWEYLANTAGLPITVVNKTIDPTWSFMTLDFDGKIRSDCSSPAAMASLIGNKDKYDIATGNDADADRHGIVTPDGGLLNPNHYLAVAIQYLFTHRPKWANDVAVGKTLVSSSMIDRVAEKIGRKLVEVPVGFKWFVPGLISGELGFGGEESAGASFLAMDGTTWTTDKDGPVLALLASEITAVTGKTPSQLYQELEDEFGVYHYARIDSDCTREQKAKLSKLSPQQVTRKKLAGDVITQVYTQAPGNGAAIGGIKVTTDRGWFAARPSGTEPKYKIYAESYVSPEHLALIQDEAKDLVREALQE